MFYQLLNTDCYSYIGLAVQISIKLLLFSHLGTALITIIFGISLLKTTKKLSSFYLFLVSLCFGLWCFLDLQTWIGSSRAIIFTWSILDMFSVSFFLFSYWFLYSFIKNEDLPTWQKVMSLSILIPTMILTGMSAQLDTFYTATYTANESGAIVNYHYFIQLFFILIITLFTFSEYYKTTDLTEKKKIALAGLGVFTFLFMFNFLSMVGKFFFTFNILGFGGIVSYYYNFDVYALFGMPVLLALLGYLIMKYQAFDLKPIKSVMLVIMLMLILFVSVFI